MKIILGIAAVALVFLLWLVWRVDSNATNTPTPSVSPGVTGGTILPAPTDTPDAGGSGEVDGKGPSERDGK